MVERIVSGGQTGVDRAALDAAISLAIGHGGWCPQGRRAEDGTIPSQYQLEETESPEYPVRTERNVLDSDATLIVFRDEITGGTKLTLRLARRHQRPHHTHDLATSADVADVRAWLNHHDVGTLNVAGPRESSSPGINREAYDFLLRCFRQASEGG